MAKAVNNPKPRPAPDARGSRYGRWVALLVTLGVAGYVASGFFFVQPDERAVIRRFGRIVEAQAEPGLHFAWPWPIGRFDKPRTREVKRITVGFDPQTRAAIAAGDLVAAAQSPESDVFTGDVNIVKATMVAQYQISAPDDYLTRTVDPDWLVKLAVQAVMIEELGTHSIESALTSAKAEIQNVTRERAQAMLDTYGCGIILVGVDLESIEPPYAIADAFRDVSSAKKDREKQIDQAESYANQIVPRAYGRASELHADAESYRSRRVEEARGDADAFLALRAQYTKAPLVTRTRLLLDTLAKVVEQAQTYVLPPESDEGAPMKLTIGQSGVN
ncbi:MAG TPA: FtsH protease activity modulator HflK [Phycisphaerae bacterium]|nr:FtsH protease activity modulator HflK [Phycisphaerales bacterium]HRX86835.1 FtsH protease activity modulator HflK [Phycisphaerae bacterium]